MKWRDIPGYEGKYQASTTGLIRSLLFKNKMGTFLRKEPLILKQVSGYNNYKRVQLSLENKTKTFLVHRLVLLTFVGPCPEGLQCGHLDGNSENNNISNLKWITCKENISHKEVHGKVICGEKNFLSKLTEKDVKKILIRFNSGAHHKDIAKEFGINQTTVLRIIKNKSWKHINRTALGIEADK